MALATGARAESFNIPPGDLKTALDIYARQSGAQLAVSGDAIKGAQTKGVKGDLSNDEALSRILSGTGFEVRNIDGSLAIVSSPNTPRPASQVKPAEGTYSVPALEEVMVTARRVEESMQEVPVAVTALSKDALERLGVKSVFDLNYAVPGLHVATFNAMDSLVVGIRGQRNQQVQPGQDPSIGTYFNDVPTGFQWGMNTGMFDLANVQVLKGPQGTLFGRNSTGGAVLINPAKPTDVFEGTVRVGVVGYDGGGGFTSTTVVNVPIDDTLSIRLGLDTTNQSGWLKNIADPAIVAALVPPHPSVEPWPGGRATLKNLGSQDSMEWRVGILWRPTDTIENYFVYDGTNYRSNGVAPSIVAANPASAHYNGSTASGATPVGPTRPVLERAQASDNFWITQVGLHLPLALDMQRFINTTTISLGDITIKNIAAWKTVHRRWSSDNLGIPYQVTSNYYPQHGYEFSEELQAEGRSFNNSLEWVTGVFYFYNKVFQDTQGSAFTYSQRLAISHNITTAWYGQATYHLPWVENLSVTGGVRYTSDIRQLMVQATGGAARTCRFNPVPTDCVLQDKQGFGHWTWNTTVNYQFDPVSTVYATYSTGYRAGGFNVSESLVTNFHQGYLPETVRNYELGLKRDWQFGNVPVRTNLAGYWQKYTDIVRQAQNPLDPRLALLVNATEADIRGVEAEIQILLTDDLQFGINYSYIDAHYTGPFIVNGVDLQNNKFSLVPATTLNLTGSYTLPLDSSIGAITFSANYYLQSRMWYDDNAQGGAVAAFDSGDGYSTLDIRLDWNSAMGSTFDVALWVKNLTNTKYYTKGAPAAYLSQGVAPNYVGLPRFVGLDVKYNF